MKKKLVFNKETEINRKKKLEFNKETKIIKVIDKKPKLKTDRATLIISILSLIVSVGALGISYSEKNTNDKQADISERNFNLEKKPVFQCYVEQQELYNDDDYWTIYEEWLDDNEIETFDQWYQQSFPEKNIPTIVEKRKFWDAYDCYDTSILADMTDGKYNDFWNEYRGYIYSTNYECYDTWKEQHVYKKVGITLENTGAYVTNARLNMYIYRNYYLDIGDDISYSFAIDMRDEVLDTFWTGRYHTTGIYDSGNNSFYIEYTQDVQRYENEYWELDDIINEDLLYGTVQDDIDVFYMYGSSVYLSINYLDNEQEEQTDWYEYDIKSNTLYYVETYDSEVEVPDITKVETFDDYNEAHTLRIAQILGYQNAQWRPFSSYKDFSYIEKAQQKILSDIKELVCDM